MAPENHNEGESENLSKERRLLIGREASSAFIKWWDTEGRHLVEAFDRLSEFGQTYMAPRPSEEPYFRGCLGRNLSNKLKERWDTVEAKHFEREQAKKVGQGTPYQDPILHE